MAVFYARGSQVTKSKLLQISSQTGDHVRNVAAYYLHVVFEQNAK